MDQTVDPHHMDDDAAEAPKPTGWFRRTAEWAGCALLLVPVTIMLHEVAHLLVALALGVPRPELHFSHISHGDLTSTPPWVLGVVAFAGPLVTVALVAAGIAWVERRRPSIWAFALVTAAASRLFVAVPHTIVTAIRWFRGDRLSVAGFDEYKGAVALGWPGNLPLVFTSLMFVGTMVWLARTLPRGHRWQAWIGLIAGTIAGWTLWMAVIGPVVLP